MNFFLYPWVLLTFVISIIDLVLFIHFTLDFDVIMQHSFGFSLNFAPSSLSILVTAQNTSGMMAALALRGYLLWFINLGLAFYLFTQTFKVYDYNKLNAVGSTGQVNTAYQNDELKEHSIYKNPPIQAFETQ